MDWSGLPSLNSLKAFAAVAETGSYTQAGALLNVTHAAVNQQVKSLEAWLSVPLVVRAGRGITLTMDGAALARDLSSGFENISKAVEGVTQASATRPVQISMSPAFAVEWLMPRLQDFQTKHPDILLMLNPSPKIVELKPGGIELAIRYRDRRTLGASVTPILISDTVVIGAASLIGDRVFDDPAMLIDMPWLQELGLNEITDWLAYRGVTLDRPLMATQMPGNLIMEAVRRGDGIAYTLRAYFESEIQSGKMKVLFSEPAFGTFYIETAPGVMRPAVKTFVNWLKSARRRIMR